VERSIVASVNYFITRLKASMDPLEQLVELLSPRASVWKRLAAEGEWAWNMPADPGIVFGRIISGTCRFTVPGHGSFEAGEGDCVLLAAPTAWTLSSAGSTAAPIDLDDVQPPALREQDGEREPEAQFRVVGGHFELDTANSELLTIFVKPVTRLMAADNPEGSLLDRLLTLVDQEALHDRPGREAVLSRLMEALLIDVLRSPQAGVAPSAGMIRGLADPQIGRVLQAFHADPAAPWTVASMTSIAHMSRSAFLRRFGSLVGQPPMSYVLQWRMATARRALARGTRTIDEVAHDIGYGSVSAFSTAFSRTVGRPPKSWARLAAAT